MLPKFFAVDIFSTTYYTTFMRNADLLLIMKFFPEK